MMRLAVEMPPTMLNPACMIALAYTHVSSNGPLLSDYSRCRNLDILIYFDIDVLNRVYRYFRLKSVGPLHLYVSDEHGVLLQKESVLLHRINFQLTPQYAGRDFCFSVVRNLILRFPLKCVGDEQSLDVQYEDRTFTLPIDRRLQVVGTPYQALLWRYIRRSEDIHQFSFPCVPFSSVVDTFGYRSEMSAQRVRSNVIHA